MWAECDCCQTVQPDVNPLGELGHWCATCASTTGGCLHAAMDDLVDPTMRRDAGRTLTTWALSDTLHKKLGSTVRNYDKAWIVKPAAPSVSTPGNPAPPPAIASWWHALVGGINHNPQEAA